MSAGFQLTADNSRRISLKTNHDMHEIEILNTESRNRRKGSPTKKLKLRDATSGMMSVAIFNELRSSSAPFLDFLIQDLVSFVCFVVK